MMVGRPVRLTVEKAGAQPGAVVLEVERLRVVDAAGVVQVDDVSFSVRDGEIYAIGGVQGNGQTEVTESLVGLDRRDRRAQQRSRPRRHDGAGSRPARSRHRLRARRSLA